MVSLVYHMYYSYTLLAISCAGVFSNVASIILVGRQRFRKMFHRLMLILAVYDLMVSQSLNLFCLHYKKLIKISDESSNYNQKRNQLKSNLSAKFFRFCVSLMKNCQNYMAIVQNYCIFDDVTYCKVKICLICISKAYLVFTFSAVFYHLSKNLKKERT